MPVRGTHKLDEFEVVEVIGSGQYGVCKKVKRKSDEKVFVWKELDYGQMTETEKKLLCQEVNLLRELKHQYIVRYYDRVIDRSNTTLYIVMEYCEGGDLASYISRCKTERRYIEENFIWKILFQLLLALQECHRRREGVDKVLHRDLKPANIFLDANRNAKLGDFGLARILAHNYSLAKTFVGTPYYMSPEVLSQQGYNESSDLWSLGCVIYELCSLSPPFNAPNQEILAVKVKEGKFRPIPSHYSTELQAVIVRLLKVEPSQRASIDTLFSTRSLRLLLWEKELHQQESELKELRIKLKTREAALDQKEKDLTAREQGLHQKDRRELLELVKVKQPREGATSQENQPPIQPTSSKPFHPKPILKVKSSRT
ncbi:serine/threonine-protein kinase Nek2-like [Dysidea avara]|uniref:serine/threonine-protein kinase Nek2-like n=1 Tax=Dysidea avara TaxID=196820 RepID=UPI0033221773